MERVLQFIHLSIPFLHLVTVAIIVLKAIIVFFNKGIDLPAFVRSFFRIYSRADFHMTTEPGRVKFMKLNNAINIYCYLWALLVALNYVIFNTLS